MRRPSTPAALVAGRHTRARNPVTRSGPPLRRGEHEALRVTRLSQVRGQLLNHEPGQPDRNALVDAPWDAYIAAPGDAPTLRETTFGGGRGLLSFRVDDDAEMIHVFAITWIG
jgi:hypothetical protein